MRADRLLSLLMLLQVRGKLSARELAEELEVSPRTIYRDVDALCAAGVPIYSETGREGSFALLDSYRTSLTGLTEGELRALFTLSIPAPLADLGLSGDLKAALLKLSASLPATRRHDEERVRQRVHLDFTGWELETEPLPYLKDLHSAVWEDRRVILKYRPPFGVEVELAAEPYGLVAKAGEWYLIFASRGRIRARRVAQFTEVRLMGEHFERPEGFDLADFWQMWCARRVQNRFNFRTRVRVAPELIPHLPWYFGSSIRRQVARAGPPDAEGWIEIDLTFDFPETARSRLLPLGGAIEVLEPEALRRSLHDFAERVVRLYDPGISTSGSGCPST